MICTLFSYGNKVSLHSKYENILLFVLFTFLAGGLVTEHGIQINKLGKGYFHVDFQRAFSNKIWEMPSSCDLLWRWKLVNDFVKIKFSGCYYHAQHQIIHLNSIPLQKPMLKVFVMMSRTRDLILYTGNSYPTVLQPEVTLCGWHGIKIQLLTNHIHISKSEKCVVHDHSKITTIQNLNLMKTCRANTTLILHFLNIPVTTRLKSGVKV